MSNYDFMASVELMILVKAPNQLIEDQQIVCQRTWTVKQLKEHLYQVYPSKPKPVDQKLIYSGQLLTDSTILSDVIKSYNGQEINTIHLVCAFNPRYKAVPTPVSPPIVVNNPLNTSPAPPQNRDTPSNNVPPNNQESDPHTLYRNAWRQILELQHNAQNMASEEQMDWLQQAYYNYLIRHYILMAEWMCNNRRYPLFDEIINSPGMNNEGMRRMEQQVQNQGLAQQNPQPAQREYDNEEEDGHLNRDILEWIYIFFRFGVLFMFVYFYSSPIRFLLVVIMITLLYRQRIAAEIEEEERVVEDPNNTQAADNQQPPPQNVFTTAWTFVSLFFLSLIPDFNY